MSYDTYSQKLMLARTTPQYIDIRAKLIIKRLICKIRFVQKGSTIDFKGFDYTKFVNGQWILGHPPNANRLVNPLGLLKLHSSISNPDKALAACIGLMYRDHLLRGFDLGRSYNGMNKYSELFFDIGRYIAKKVCATHHSKDYLAQRWRDIIDEEWNRTKNRIGQCPND